MSDTLFTDDCEVILNQSFVGIDEAIRKRRQAAAPVAPSAEREVCIEARSLVIAFEELVLSRGLDEGLAVKVLTKLGEALAVLTTEQGSIFAVRKELEQDVPNFVTKRKTGALSALPPLAERRFSFHH